MNAGMVGEQRQFGAVLQAEDFEERRDVRLDRALADLKLARDGEIVRAGGEPAQHIALACGDPLPETLLSQRFGPPPRRSRAEPRRGDERQHIGARGLDLRIERSIRRSLPLRSTDDDDSGLGQITAQRMHEGQRVFARVIEIHEHGVEGVCLRRRLELAARRVGLEPMKAVSVQELGDAATKQQLVGQDGDRWRSSLHVSG